MHQNVMLCPSSFYLNILLCVLFKWAQYIVYACIMISMNVSHRDNSCDADDLFEIHYISLNVHTFESFNQRIAVYS